MLFYLLIVTLGAASADTGCSVCPDVTPVQKVDYNAFYSGIWYLYYRFFDKWEIGLQCNTMVLDEENETFTVTAVKDGKLVSFGGYVSHEKDRGIFTFCSERFVEYMGVACIKIYVVYVNECESALLYHCSISSTGDTQEIAWALTREAILEGSDKIRIENYFNSTTFIDPSRYLFVKHTPDVCNVQ